MHSSYNLNRLGSPTGADFIGHSGLYDGVGSNYMGMGVGMGLGASPPPPPLQPHNLYSSPLPRRRYSIGGLPSASMTEYLHLMQQNADAAHLSTLLNETKTSITRASQILSRGEDISDDILLSSAAGDLAAQFGRLHATDTDINTANILNQLPTSTNSFSSHPNIYYSQPNYHNQTTISSHDYLNRFKKPSSYQLYSRPLYSASATNHHTYATPSAHHPYTSSAVYYQQPYGNLNYQKYYPNQAPPPYSSLSQYRPLHHTSNPAISQSSNYYFKHHSNIANTVPAPYHHHPFSGYSNQHFDLHHYSNCYPKLDLDYSKPGEHTKRQVSFNVDVDTLSIES